MQSWIVTTDGTVQSSGTHVVRRVEELGAEAPQLERDRDVLAEPVAGRAVDDRDEVLGEVAQRGLVAGVAEEQVGRVVVEARQVADHVADVGSDPVVAPFAYVDRDLHGAQVPREQ